MATLTLGQGAASTGREMFTAATKDSAVGGRMKRESAPAAILRALRALSVVLGIRTPPPQSLYDRLLWDS